ncbi:MAG: hypothetical protein FJ135_14060 [Deltaproteobacteria bacterium]|nr:hypothetical protein [Deltaproteobacteria bacterium]
MNGDFLDYVRHMRSALHDLAQPLSVMAGAVDLLMFETDPHSQQFDDIRQISNQLQLIIDKMTAIRQMTQKITASVGPLDVRSRPSSEATGKSPSEKFNVQRS